MSETVQASEQPKLTKEPSPGGGALLNAPVPGVPTGADLKLQLEIDKLQAEIAVLRRPWYRNAPIVLTAATVVAGALGIGIQYVKSDRAYELAKIERAQAQLDIAQLAVEKQKAARAVVEVGQQAQALSARQHQLTASVAQAESSLATARSLLAGSPTASSSEQATAAQALRAAASELRSLKQEQARASRAAAATQAALADMENKLAANDSTQYFVWLGSRHANGTLTPNRFQLGAIPLSGAVIRSAELVTRWKFENEGRPDWKYVNAGTFPAATPLILLRIDSLPVGEKDRANGYTHILWARVIKQPQ